MARVNISKIAREAGLPYQTLWVWVKNKDIELPRDIELLKQLKLGSNGRWYLPDRKTNRFHKEG